MARLLKNLENSFLKAYRNSSFVNFQKAKVLFWLHTVLIPFVIFYVCINLWRNKPGELLGIIIVDCLFIGVLLTGLYLLKKGRHTIVGYLDIGTIIFLTIAGSLIKVDAQTTTGFNSFYLILMAAMTFIAMYGNRNILLFATLTYLGLILMTHFMAAFSILPQMNVYLISGTLNAIIALIIICSITYMNGLITETALKTTKHELEKNIELQRVLEQKVEERTRELKILKGLIPICSLCKNIRDDKGYWNQIESYISTHTEAEFSHSICPHCAQKYYSDLKKHKKCHSPNDSDN